MHPEEAELAPVRAAGAARDEQWEKLLNMEAVGCIIAGGREAKTKILVCSFRHLSGVL